MSKAVSNKDNFLIRHFSTYFESHGKICPVPTPPPVWGLWVSHAKEFFVRILPQPPPHEGKSFFMSFYTHGKQQQRVLQSRSSLLSRLIILFLENLTIHIDIVYRGEGDILYGRYYNLNDFTLKSFIFTGTFITFFPIQSLSIFYTCRMKQECIYIKCLMDTD